MTDTPAVQAKHYTPTAGRQIDLIVIHDMEAPEKPGTAESVAAWFAGPTAPRASAHWCFDSDSAVRCVADQDVAWHAPGANHNGLGYEHAGFARQTREEWLDDYGQQMLAISAAQARHDCAAYGLPMVFVDAAGLKRGERGVTTHWEVSQAFHRSTHWDPGPGFPMDAYLNMAATGTFPHIENPLPAATGSVLRRGSRGEDVRAWQTVLRGAGLLRTPVDGVFGADTERATREWQSIIGVTADGIVGPVTSTKTAQVLAWVVAVNAQHAPAAPPFPGMVRLGSRGPTVSAVQARLRERGWSVTVDGVFGPQTDDRIRKFQAEKGLRVDGIVGPQTWQALWTAPVT